MTDMLERIHFCSPFHCFTLHGLSQANMCGWLPSGLHHRFDSDTPM